MAKKLWAADTAEAWQQTHASAADTWQSHASAKLLDLNRWYESELPPAISSRAPRPHITQPELVKLVDWKLSRGKWRPRLLDFAKAAKSPEVFDTSTTAFSILLKQHQQAATQQQQPPSSSAVQSALAELTKLKGVGPATASALLAVADGSGSTPFMSDEALEAAVGSRSYTAKEYLQLVDALRAKAAWLAEQDAEGGWTAVQVERCLYAAQLATKPPPAAPKGSKSGAAAKKGAAAGAGAKGKTKAAAGAGGGGSSKRAKKA